MSVADFRQCIDGKKVLCYIDFADPGLIVKKWDDIYNNLDSLTQEDRNEIELKVKIIEQILEARKEKGLTQTELEAISGIKQTFIARLENNRMDPQLTTILKLLKPLGMTLEVVPIKEWHT